MNDENYTCSTCKSSVSYESLAAITHTGCTCLTCAAEYTAKRMAKAKARKGNPDAKQRLIAKGWKL